jgi:hypothetical protein
VRLAVKHEEVDRQHCHDEGVERAPQPHLITHGSAPEDKKGETLRTGLSPLVAKVSP